MKKLLSTFYFVLTFGCAIAQNEKLEAEIRSLEQLEVEAILKKDTVTLLKLWDKDYVVNTPNNMIVFAGKTAIDRPVLRNARTSFTRNVEQIIIRGNIVMAMGSETVVPETSQSNAGEVKRRYTNIWMNLDGTWKIVGRHANVICK